MNVGQLSSAIGQHVDVRFEQLSIPCRVRDVRQVWNGEDVLVTPRVGAGEQWVSIERCAVPPGGGERGVYDDERS